jgi:hypothetical protein
MARNYGFGEKKNLLVEEAGLGFDTKSNGLSCVLNLVFSGQDRNMLESLLLILSEGVEGSDMEWNDLLEWYEIEMFLASDVRENLELRNILYTMYEVICAYRSGKPIRNYRLFYDVIGKKINRVYSENKLIPSDAGGVFAQKDVLLECGKMHLRIERLTPSLIVQPKGNTDVLIDNTDVFSDIIGKTIKGFRFAVDRRRRVEDLLFDIWSTYVDFDDETTLLIAACKNDKYAYTLLKYPQGGG